MGKKILGIDWGEKRCGIAISDEEGKFAFAREVCAPEIIIERIKYYIKEEEISKIVIGMPTSLSGDEKIKSRLGKFTEEIRVLGVEVVFFDERFTSGVVDQIFLEQKISQKKGREFRDAIAAQIILEDYLKSSSGHTRGRQK